MDYDNTSFNARERMHRLNSLRDRLRLLDGVVSGEDAVDRDILDRADVQLARAWMSGSKERLDKAETAIDEAERLFADEVSSRKRYKRWRNGETHLAPWCAWI